MHVTTERRNRTRTRPPGLVYAELGPRNGGMMRDLSEEGFAMRAMMPLRVGDITPFTLQLDAIIRLEGQCQVIWVKEDGRLLGLRFIDNSSKLRGQIRAWLASKETQSPENRAAPVEPHQPATMDELREEMRSIGSRDQSRTEEARQESSREESSREESSRALLPGQGLKSSLPPYSDPAEPAPPDPAATLPGSPPPLPPLEPAKHLPRLPSEPGALPNRQSEILGLSLTPDSDTYLPFRSLASLEPLSILEKRNSPRAGSSWLENFSLPGALGVLLCIALLASGFVFHDELGQILIWLGQKMSGMESVQLPPPADSRNPVPPTGQLPENSSSPASRSDSGTANSAPAKGSDAPPLAQNLPRQNPSTQTLASSQKQSQTSPGLMPLTQTNKPGPAPANPASSTSSPADGAEPGLQEFQAARSILRNENRESEIPDAVRLLWAAVEKGSTSAELTLAELYRTGHGVSKNCDQTRILLTAAANRGNPEAKRQLANFMAAGCQ
jgi:hypothetical protein